MNCDVSRQKTRGEAKLVMERKECKKLTKNGKTGIKAVNEESGIYVEENLFLTCLNSLTKHKC